jgi:hypothetical protein
VKLRLAADRTRPDHFHLNAAVGLQALDQLGAIPDFTLG